MLAIIGWIVFGLIAGLIAKAIMPGGPWWRHSNDP
jgi:uncharacterized membrane protein YeaQ/YmgE (transglycosylase-associated protein family)